MDTACSIVERRAFLKALTATTAVLATGGCGVSGSPNSWVAAAVNPGTPQAPVWSTVPTITFTQGVQSTISIAGFVSDPNGDALAITLNSAALPTGVTYDAANKRFVYDGNGLVGSTGGHVLTADDGQP